ncbi:MAG: cyanophycinase [Nitrospirae bacterium]|nr:cyanophycinase [Nitrospirota bacterium]
MIIGGAEDRSGERRVLRAFVELAGGRDARIVIIAVASATPTVVGSTYVQIIKELGTKQATLLDLATREDVVAPRALETIHKATGVFFTGGDQVRISQLIGGTALDRLLITRHREGLVVGGTSAGAAIMSSIMIVGGLGYGSLRMDNVELGSGMEFLPGAIIDQHFQQRWRFRRLLAAVAQYPFELGIGIDEDTAIIVQNGMFQVIGSGGVTVIDGKRITHVSRPEASDDGILALCGLTVHVLTENMGYDLKSRKPIVDWRQSNETRSSAR